MTEKEETALIIFLTDISARMRSGYKDRINLNFEHHTTWTNGKAKDGGQRKIYPKTGIRFFFDIEYLDPIQGINPPEVDKKTVVKKDNKKTIVKKT